MPPSHSCQTLGQVMRQNAHRQASAKACMNVSVSFLVFNVWENDAWIKVRWQRSALLASMGGMLGQAMHQKARRLALAYTNVRFYVFSFLVFIR